MKKKIEEIVISFFVYAFMALALYVFGNFAYMACCPPKYSEIYKTTKEDIEKYNKK